MSITLFARRDFKGDDITGADLSHFSQIAHPMVPTSIRMTSASDRILLFTRPNWQGRAKFLSGAQSIEHLGHRGDGGEAGFGNTISSMRVTPFRMKLRFHVVTSRNPNVVFPGGLANGVDTEQYINEAVTRANVIWGPKLLQFELESVKFPEDVSEFFNLNKEFWRIMLNSRKFDRAKGVANIVLVNNLGGNVIGTSVPHGLSKMIAVEAVQGGAGHTVAHEMGHFLGMLMHEKATDNLMSPSGSGIVLTDEQVADAHQSLSHFAELDRGLRIE